MLMLVNPYSTKETTKVYPGTRILQAGLNIIGTKIPDYYDIHRDWTVKSLYAPIQNRTIGGIRVKLVDQKGFITFCNQMDAEVLLGIGKPGTLCHWANRKYAAPGDQSFYGFVVDEEDLYDDMFDRELLIRAENNGFVPNDTALKRCIHMEESNDVEEYQVFLGDWDRETGVSPDPRFGTLGSRWQRAERSRVTWALVDLTCL